MNFSAVKFVAGGKGTSFGGFDSSADYTTVEKKNILATSLGNASIFAPPLQLLSAQIWQLSSKCVNANWITNNRSLIFQLIRRGNSSAPVVTFLSLQIGLKTERNNYKGWCFCPGPRKALKNFLRVFEYGIIPVYGLEALTLFSLLRACSQPTSSVDLVHRRYLNRKGRFRVCAHTSGKRSNDESYSYIQFIRIQFLEEHNVKEFTNDLI